MEKYIASVCTCGCAHTHTHTTRNRVNIYNHIKSSSDEKHSLWYSQTLGFDLAIKMNELDLTVHQKMGKSSNITLSSKGAICRMLNLVYYHSYKI